MKNEYVKEEKKIRNIINGAQRSNFTLFIMSYFTRRKKDIGLYIPCNVANKSQMTCRFHIGKNLCQTGIWDVSRAL